MIRLPTEARAPHDALAPAPARPTSRRSRTPSVSSTLATGRRAVAELLRTAVPLAGGHTTTSRRALSSASWSALRLARGLCPPAPRLIPADRAAPLLGDDSAERITPAVATPSCAARSSGF